MISLQDTIVANAKAALSEDVGSGDLTASLVSPSKQASAKIISREAAVISGIEWVNETFRQVDSDTQVSWFVEDGDAISDGEVLCSINGAAKSILTAERCALNFLQTLSGTATVTSRFVGLVSGTKTRILDTRKTLPGLRLAQKYAVKCGGGENHRMGLYDAILIKENHISAAGSISLAVKRAREHAVEIEVEVESLQQLEEALNCDVERILLDNFSVEDMRLAVETNRGRSRLEASGNVSPETILEIARTGVDDISIGALTKHVRAIDFSMLFED